MALGIPGTGPYGSIRGLQKEIKDCKYELRLIAQGMRRRLGSKRLNEIIKTNRDKIKEIKAAEKAKKSNS
jgi:hypothetical protein